MQQILNPRNYQKINQRDKMKLFELYYDKGQNIKQAAAALNLKYPAAKAAIKSFQMKKLRIKPIYKNKNRCSYRKISNQEQSNEISQQSQDFYYTIIIMLVGKLIYRKQIMIHRKYINQIINP